jgi:hypothetical protein
LNVHDLLRLNDHFVPEDDDLTSFAADSIDVTLEVNNERKVNMKKLCYEDLCPYFPNVSADTVRHTLDNTTQSARSVDISPNMFKKFRSPFPACNVKRRNKAIIMDTIYTNVPALGTGGITMAQIFVG